ncbi:hypothetical protein BH10PAT1_BH10PAT1_7370 [soil metagenome]
MQINLITNPLWEVVKLFFVIGISVYLIFALVVVKQIQIMSQTVRLGFELPIKILGVIHLLFALGLLIFAIIVL